jgi:hypothetical protein
MESGDIGRPSTDAGQEGEHEVELLLNRRTVRGVTRYLLRWRGHASADDEWLRLEELAHCPAKVAECDAAAPRRRHAARRHAAAPAAASPVVPASALLEAPTGFRLAVPAEVVTGRPLWAGRYFTGHTAGPRRPPWHAGTMQALCRPVSRVGLSGRRRRPSRPPSRLCQCHSRQWHCRVAGSHVIRPIDGPFTSQGKNDAQLQTARSPPGARARPTGPG